MVKTSKRHFLATIGTLRALPNITVKRLCVSFLEGSLCDNLSNTNYFPNL